MPHSLAMAPRYINSRHIGDQAALHKSCYYLPLSLFDSAISKTDDGSQTQIFGKVKPRANLSRKARRYLDGLGLREQDADADPYTGRLIWMHGLAICFSPTYLFDNADGIRAAWPRVPLPRSLTLLKSSALLGEQLSTLLDSEARPSGQLDGVIRQLKHLAKVSRVGGGMLLSGPGDLDVSAGWGSTGKGGRIKPGVGRATPRQYTTTELEELKNAAQTFGIRPEEVIAVLGARTWDIYLNDRAFWANVPERVWNYQIGGFQVLKKWLAYREQIILKRALTSEEARIFSDISRRLTVISLLSQKLNKNYNDVCSNVLELVSGQ